MKICHIPALITFFCLSGCVAVRQDQKRSLLRDEQMPFEAKQMIAMQEEKMSAYEEQGGSSHSLSAFLIKKNERSFASYSLKAPDPDREKISDGQSLVIHWSLAKKDLQSIPEDGLARLEIDLLFAKQSREILVLPIESFSGKQEIFFSKEQVAHKGMPLAYHLELKNRDGQVLVAAPHRLWGELLEFAED